MLNKIIMPPGGQTSNESQICRWHKHEGDFVARGDVLFEVETDKTTLDVESFCEGILLRTCFDEGDTVGTGVVVAYIGDETDRNQLPKDLDEKSPGTPSEAANGQPASQHADVPSGVLASPAAKKLARDLHVDLNEIAKGSDGVIKVKQVMGYVETRPAAEPEYEIIVPDKMRSAIARRMSQSAAVPAFTAEIRVDMTQCMEMRRRRNEALTDQNIKISYNDIIMKCMAAAIGKTPAVNSSWTDEGIRRYKHVHCGLAVGMDAGLVVPVVRNVQDKNIVQIAACNSTNIEKARMTALSMEDQSGGTITLSNLGMFGINRFTALLNPPEACILAVGSIQTEPVVENGAIAYRSIMNITATFDHRIIDGAVGASFLSNLRELLESPVLLFL